MLHNLTLFISEISTCVHDIVSYAFKRNLSPAERGWQVVLYFLMILYTLTMIIFNICIDYFFEIKSLFNMFLIFVLSVPVNAFGASLLFAIIQYLGSYIL